MDYFKRQILGVQIAILHSNAMDFRVLRGGSVCLNSQRWFLKWTAAAVMLLPILAAARFYMPHRAYARQAMNGVSWCCRRQCIARCRMLNRVIAGSVSSKYLSSDNDPLFRYRQWQANLRILEAEVYTPSIRPYTELADIDYPFHDRDSLVTACGRICMHRKKINISIALAGQSLGINEVDDGIWLISFMKYDLGYIDLDQKILQTIDNPFGTRLSPMS
jgi:hypothetical protein